VRMTLNRPKVFNAIDLEMATELTEQLMSLSADERMQAVVLTGNGNAFCAGGDLKWMHGFEEGAAAAVRRLVTQFHLAITEIRTMRRPVIAAINGVAAGGGFSLALACDFRVMSENATLRQSYTSKGLSIDGGGTFMLPRLVGLAKALEIAAFDRPIDAHKAQAWGLATQVVGNGEAERAAMKLADELCGRSMNSLAWSKRLLSHSFQTDLASQLEAERAAIVACASHADGLEGLKAFVEKREPHFAGRD